VSDDAQPRVQRYRLRFAAFAAGIGAAAFFMLGAAPGYSFELDGHIDASRFCPAPPSSETSWDHDCAMSIVARGPLYLGKESLTVSFVLGLASIVSLWLADRVRLRWPRLMLSLGSGIYLACWALLLLWNEAEGDRLASVAPTIVGS
jgi:hypothetical protein